MSARRPTRAAGGLALRLGAPQGPLGPWHGALAGGDRYSRRVAFLKVLLPALGVALILLVAAWPRLAGLFDTVRLGLPAVDLRQARQLKMVDPRYAGFDRQHRPYLLQAAIARQIPERRELVSLEHPRARIRMAAGAVTATAASGIYQSQARLLDLFRDVTIRRQDGTKFVTARAHVNFAKNAAKGNDAIAGHGPWGTVRAHGFRILDDGKTVIFTGAAELVLNGAAARRPASPPALPRSVAAQAAAIARAAAARRAMPRRPLAKRRHAG